MTFGPIANCDAASIDGNPILESDLILQLFDLTDGFSCGFGPTNVLLTDIFFTAGAPPPPETCVFTPQGAAPVSHGSGLFNLDVASRTQTVDTSSPIWGIFFIIQVEIDVFSETNVTIQNAGVNGVSKVDLVTPITWNLQSNGTNVFVNGVMQPGLIATLTTIFLVPNGGGSFNWSNILTQPVALEQINVSGTPNVNLFGYGMGVYYGAITIAEFLEDPTGTPTEYPEGNPQNFITGGITMGSSYVGYLSKDVSGIYTLVANQRFDREYVRAGSTLTQDVQIPNPFAELGFTECDDE